MIRFKIENPMYADGRANLKFRSAVVIFYIIFKLPKVNMYSYQTAKAVSSMSLHSWQATEPSLVGLTLKDPMRSFVEKLCKINVCGFEKKPHSETAWPSQNPNVV